MLYKVGGIAILLLMAVIFTMMICAYLDEAKKEARKEERNSAKSWAIRVAKREYQRLIDTTEFKVKQAVVISNESDIQW